MDINYKCFISPDGGGKLDLYDFTVLCKQVTTRNQNPILYLAYMARAVEEFQKPEQLELVNKHAKIVSLGKGRYLRRKCDPLRQSHDNVLAWAWWSVQLLNPIWATEIYNFSKWRFFVYDPHHFFSLDPRCILQGGQVFTLALAANKRPGWLTTLWFAGACLVTDHSGDAYLKSMLWSDIVRAKQNLLSKYKHKVVFWALELLEKRRGSLGKWYIQYYEAEPKHPSIIGQLKKENLL